MEKRIDALVSGRGEYKRGQRAISIKVSYPPLTIASPDFSIECDGLLLVDAILELMASAGVQKAQDYISEGMR